MYISILERETDSSDTPDPEIPEQDDIPDHSPPEHNEIPEAIEHDIPAPEDHDDASSLASGASQATITCAELARRNQRARAQQHVQEPPQQQEEEEEEEDDDTRSRVTTSSGVTLTRSETWNHYRNEQISDLILLEAEEVSMGELEMEEEEEEGDEEEEEEESEVAGPSSAIRSPWVRHIR